MIIYDPGWAGPASFAVAWCGSRFGSPWVFQIIIIASSSIIIIMTASRFGFAGGCLLPSLWRGLVQGLGLLVLQGGI